jgi:hypothetical protein
MGEARPSEEPSEPEEKRPSGIPDAASSARRKSFRPPPKHERRARSEAPPAEAEEAAPRKRPRGLKKITESARLRLQLALDYDDEDGDRPPGLPHITTSARQRLELALEHDLDEDIHPPAALPAGARASLPGSKKVILLLDKEGRKVLRSLGRWLAFCGLLDATVGALTGLSYLTGPGGVAHVVVGILATALSVWLLAAAYAFHRVVSGAGQRHLLVNGLGLLRSALLLKAILLFAAMVLGCFTFSIATGLLLLL